MLSGVCVASILACTWVKSWEAKSNGVSLRSADQMTAAIACPWAVECKGGPLRDVHILSCTWTSSLCNCVEIAVLIFEWFHDPSGTGLPHLNLLLNLLSRDARVALVQPRSLWRSFLHGVGLPKVEIHKHRLWKVGKWSSNGGIRNQKWWLMTSLSHWDSRWNLPENRWENCLHWWCIFVGS